MDWFNSWQFLAFCSAFFAGLTAFLGKVGVADVNSNMATLIRTGIVFLLTAVILSIFNQWQRPQEITNKTWIFLLLSGITTALSWLCYYRAFQLGPVSKVASIDKLSIAVAILLGVILLGEKLSWQTALGGVLIVIGAILIAA
jgi:transporter family protein